MKTLRIMDTIKLSLFMIITSHYYHFYNILQELKDKDKYK